MVTETMTGLITLVLAALIALIATLVFIMKINKLDKQNDDESVKRSLLFFLLILGTAVFMSIIARLFL